MAVTIKAAQLLASGITKQVVLIDTVKFRIGEEWKLDKSLLKKISTKKMCDITKYLVSLKFLSQSPVNAQYLFYSLLFHTISRRCSHLNMRLDHITEAYNFPVFN